MGKRFNRQQRTTARLTLVQLFFATHHGEGVTSESDVLNFFEPEWEKPDMHFIKERYQSICKNKDIIDEHIQNGLQDGWKVEKVDKVLHALLVVATDEMISTHTTTPLEILVKEYADLTGDFFNKAETSFANAYFNTLKETISKTKAVSGMH
jgi:transcription termination factor NusB